MDHWSATARRLLDEEVTTPFYLSSTQKLTENLSRARRAFNALQKPLGLAYSVKTNYLAAFVKEALAQGQLIEVVSHHEYDYVVSLGVPPGRVLVNGPAKTQQFMREALQSGARVNVDSIVEARYVAETFPGVPIGVRVAAELSAGKTSRFGIDCQDRESLLVLRDLISEGLAVRGLHIHHSSRRDAASYVERVSVLVEAQRNLELEDLLWLDLGGGFSSQPPARIREKLPYPLSSWEEVGASVCEAIADAYGGTQPQVIIEPGIGVLADTMAYVMRVAAVKRGAGYVYAITDGSMFEVNPLRSQIPPPADLIPLSGGGGEASEILLCGSTCMEIDTFGELHAANGIAPGDAVLVSNVGAYAYCLAPDFIVPKAAVYDMQGDLLLARQRRGSLGARP